MTNYTLGGNFERSGVGLHSGILTTVRVLPAAVGEGRYFVRVDLPGMPVVPARVEAVRDTVLSTELGTLLKDDSNASYTSLLTPPADVPNVALSEASRRVYADAGSSRSLGVTRSQTQEHFVSAATSPSQDASVRTVEHLLAALAGSGVDNARIEIDGPEVPLLDGSARVWVEAIREVGVVRQGDAGNEDSTLTQGREDALNFSTHTGVSLYLPLPVSSFVLQEPIWVYQGDAFVAALPSPKLRFTYGIDFELPAIGNQWHSWTPEQGNFAEEIAPARTFGLAHQVEALRDRGLIKGGSLENALVCDRSGWLNPPLRFSNEPVRHKLLDLVGDLSLLGTYPVAHFLAYKASHNLHIQLAKKLVQQLVEG